MSTLVRIDARGLPAAPLDAAAAFHARVIPAVRKAAGSDVAVLFDMADHTHRNWRVAVVEELAREAAPCRVNGVAGPDGDGVDQTCAYLAAAPGVTGQLLQVDGNSADNP